jgi:hypothetical protein
MLTLLSFRMKGSEKYSFIFCNGNVSFIATVVVKYDFTNTMELIMRTSR